jgi:lathosterol oxidase
MWLGLMNMSLAAAAFGVVSWGVFEQGWSKLYYDISDYGYGYFFFSIFICWLFIETCAFYVHAGAHIGWLYTKIHSVHHRYSAPTFWTISAMHPLEWIAHSSYIILPPFIFPISLEAYVFVVACTFIAGYWDHAGIRFPIDLPLHGSNRFHDDHHKYFHVNFGFTCSLFDKIHDTVRREGHHYSEETFLGGKGRVKDPVLREKGAIGKWVDYSPAATDAILANRVEKLKAKKNRGKKHTKPQTGTSAMNSETT